MSNRVFALATFLLILLLIASCGLSYWLYTSYQSPKELAALSDAQRLTRALSDAQSEKEALEAKLEQLNGTKESLEMEVQSKLESITALQHKIDVLIEEGTASDEYQQILLEEVERLKAEAEADREQIASLSELIANYENITTLNFGYQARKISDLLLKLAEPNRPLRVVVTEEENEETGEKTETVTETPAQLSFYYRDLSSGYTLSYHSDDVMYSASLIKAPYIYSMLYAVAEFEENKRLFDTDGNPLYDEEGNALFEGPHPNLDENGRIRYAPGEEKYDLSRVWTFNKEKMTVEGSGVLADAEDGTQLTYLELAKYALMYSDNVAFAQLREMFGYVEYYAAARRLGIRGSAYGFMQLTSDDCGKFLEAIYTFTEENEPYGSVMKDAMLHSNYAVLITSAVYPTPCAHKYGWDEASYHDMAIVYDEHPYVLAIMTDLDQGGNTVNAYIREVVRMIHSIHRNFYAS